ncbi:SirB2 family protein [Psychromonas sp. KJ10-10]|uniref:SirB2 family protein n=1 Tax=Psychromonas sp. KJ10-10 TaxID=3391823 RepID=UPI0039B52BD7
MYGFLKHTHMTLILIAVVLFIVNFYWLKTGHKNAQKPVFKKILLHTHLTIFLLGAGLIGLLQINPFAESGYWVLEKVVAFVFYLIMVKSALTENKPTKMQLISFLGALGWLAYIVKLALSKQAILLVG